MCPTRANVQVPMPRALVAATAIDHQFRYGRLVPRAPAMSAFESSRSLTLPTARLNARRNRLSATSSRKVPAALPGRGAAGPPQMVWALRYDRWHGRRMTPEPDPTVRSRRCTGVVAVPLPASEAIKLFTPEGERLWAGRAGWAPTYPDPARTEGAGTVFETQHGHRHITWVITSQTPDQVSYARVSSTGTAGTVEVRIDQSDADTTTVQVSYDLTALTDSAAQEIATFASNYDREMAEWAADINAAVTAASDH